MCGMVVRCMKITGRCVEIMMKCERKMVRGKEIMGDGMIGIMDEEWRC